MIFRLPTLTVNIDEDESDLTTQQRLVLEQHYDRLNRLERANEHLDSKALTLLQSAGLIMALVGVLKVPSFVTQEPNNWVRFGILISFVAFLLMTGAIVKTWSPTDRPIPGTQDWNEVYDEYLLVDRNKAYNKILVDCMHAFDQILLINRHKTRMLRWAAGLFILQIGGLLIVALLA